METIQKTPLINNRKELKKLFHGCLKLIFESNIALQSVYGAEDISLTIQSAMRNGEYIESFVRNNPSPRTPSGDTMYRRLSESMNLEAVDSLIEITVKIGKSLGVISGKVNVAIDEHDEPYYGNDKETRIIDLAETIIELTGSSSKIVFQDMPEHDPMRRAADISKMAKFGWRPRIGLEEGIRKMLFS